MLVAVMQVVDNSHIRHVQRLEDRELIFRLAEPAAVIVEPHLAADFLRRLCNWPNAVRFRRDAPTLLLDGSGRGAASHHPELRPDVVPLEHGENVPRFVIEYRGE